MVSIERSLVPRPYSALPNIRKYVEKIGGGCGDERAHGVLLTKAMVPVDSKVMSTAFPLPIVRSCLGNSYLS